MSELPAFKVGSDGIRRPRKPDHMQPKRSPWAPKPTTGDVDSGFDERLRTKKPRPAPKARKAPARVAVEDRLPPADPKRRLSPAEMAELSERAKTVELNWRGEQTLRQLSSHVGTERGADYSTAGMVARALTGYARANSIHIVGARGGGRIDGFVAYQTLAALERRGLVTRYQTDEDWRNREWSTSDHWRITDFGIAWLAQADR